MAVKKGLYYRTGLVNITSRTKSVPNKQQLPSPLPPPPLPINHPLPPLPINHPLPPLPINYPLPPSSQLPFNQSQQLPPVLPSPQLNNLQELKKTLLRFDLDSQDLQPISHNHRYHNQHNSFNKPPITCQLLPPITPTYFGDDVHAYTGTIRRLVDGHIETLYTKNGGRKMIDDEQFVELLKELEQKFGYKSAYQNMKTLFHDGWIRDPDLPSLNSAVLLSVLWQQMKTINEPSAYAHFNETLDQIGNTCPQGVSHRLFCDYVAFS